MKEEKIRVSSMHSLQQSQILRFPDTENGPIRRGILENGGSCVERKVLSRQSERLAIIISFKVRFKTLENVC